MVPRPGISVLASSSVRLLDIRLAQHICWLFCSYATGCRCGSAGHATSTTLWEEYDGRQTNVRLKNFSGILFVIQFFAVTCFRILAQSLIHQCAYSVPKATDCFSDSANLINLLHLTEM
ncbi:unnamed protein product [Calicophoron daubneyi]|uniref:Secreted protein n=1 Tax=Calicophoron daubneyi TaxID=300641 RepID=A0AAV2TWQ5_CALDB